TSKKNGKYIFLPAAGFYYSGLPTYEGGDGYYWLSTPDEADHTDFAGILQINDEQHFDRRSNSRFIGMTIRPVLAPVPEPEVEYVDLALPSGTKWATCNLGASSPEDHGDYYGWGCTEPYKDTDYVYWPLYFQKLGGTGTSKEDCGTDADPLKYYVLNMKSIAGTEWDAVHLDIGGKWHIPTEDEFLELLNTDNCSCTWDSEKYGYTVTSKKNGNSIFLPAAGSRDRTSSSLYGIGHYWSSTPAERYNFGSCGFTFYPVYDWSATSNNRYEGMPIRPVSK
ncbi:MAG: hypothetical protein HUK13_03955, partial [Muribaculaceae bacterium]|nr:hypothetical protein [Muribaculaceae bacterium]